MQRDDRHLLQHAATFSGLLLVLVVVIKTIRVAHMDLTTALMLTAHGSISATITGMLLLIFPAFVPALLALALLNTIVTVRRLMKQPPSRAPAAAVTRLLLSVVLLVVAAFLMIYAVPAKSFSFLILAGFIVYGHYVGDRMANFVIRRTPIVRWLMPNRRKHLLFGWSVGTLAATGLFVLAPVALTVFSDAVWLPPERLVRRGQPEAVVVYEVSSSDRRILYLHESDRTIFAVAPEDVTEQQPCRLLGYINSEPSLYDKWVEAPAAATSQC